MPTLAKIASEKYLKIKESGQLRCLSDIVRLPGNYVIHQGRKLLSFSCNDYLGLAHNYIVQQQAELLTQEYAGATSSRLITGNHPLYTILETQIAEFHQQEAACVFGSGYLANIGTIPAIVSKGDLIIADKLSHACLIDGAILSQAKLVRFKHNDLESCARYLKQYRNNFRYCLIITEDVFSMDGDVAPLSELKAIAASYNAWLMSDGAHNLEHALRPVDLVMGTFSKAFASYGGYVCASQKIIDYLKTSARSLIYSTALPPAIVAYSIASLAHSSKHPELKSKAIANAALFAELMGVSQPESQIVPLIIGDNNKAIAMSEKLQNDGFLVKAIRPPTVPAGSARLRLSFSSAHQAEDIIRLTSSIKKHL